MYTTVVLEHTPVSSALGLQNQVVYMQKESL